MRDSAIGLALGLVLLAGLFAADRYLPRTGVENPAISPDFVGARHMGDWLLVCAPFSRPSRVPIPFSLTPNSAARAPAPLGRCRLSLLMARKDRPRQIVLAAHFRLTGQVHALTLILRFPPVGQGGRWVAVRTAGKAFRVPIIGCSQRLCTAGGRVGGPIESLLAKEMPAQLALPAANNSKPLVLPLPLKGLKDGLSALRKVENQAGAGS